ncbi:hypothetical protein Pelo_16839 [Pelomyxa schiedti]|nr:hypothetical protein Pelo_16839 [Pelomyxa schiedti]
MFLAWVGVVACLLGASVGSDWIVGSEVGHYSLTAAFCQPSAGTAGWSAGEEELWATSTSGKNWTQIVFDTMPVTRFVDSAMSGSDVVLCGPGDGDNIVGCVYSKDCGGTWSLADESYPRVDWFDVKPIIGSTGYFVRAGEWYTLLRSGSGIGVTTDAGLSWTNHALELDGVTAHSASFISSLVGWVVGGVQSSDITKTQALVAKTTSGGRDWDVLYNVTEGGYFVDVYFTDTMHGWAILNVPKAGEQAAHGLIVATIDGGLSWATQATLPDVTMKKMYMISKTEGWVVGGYEDGLFYRSQLIHTTDGGAAWASFEIRGQIVTNVDGYDSSHVWASAEAESDLSGSILQWVP